jgi:hypothetical protein
MQSSLPSGPAEQNITAVDLAEFAEIAKIVDVIGSGPIEHANSPSLALKRAG